MQAAHNLSEVVSELARTSTSAASAVCISMASMSTSARRACEPSSPMCSRRAPIRLRATLLHLQRRHTSTADAATRSSHSGASGEVVREVGLQCRLAHTRTERQSSIRSVFRPKPRPLLVDQRQDGRRVSGPEPVVSSRGAAPSSKPLRAQVGAPRIESRPAARRTRERWWLRNGDLSFEVPTRRHFLVWRALRGALARDTVPRGYGRLGRAPWRAATDDLPTN